MSEMRAFAQTLERDRGEVSMTYEDKYRLERQIAALAESNGRLRDELGRAASQHARVASVLAACHRLHSTLDRSGMLIALHEVLVGLVGCEQAAVWERKGEHAGFTLAACFGVTEKELSPLPETILSSMLAGKLFVGVADTSAVPRRPSVCVPLRVDGRVVGAIAVFRLADRKPGLSGADWDLLDLLGAHVAMALVATRASIAQLP